MTRDEFLAAVRVVEEGRSTHSLYAVEHASYSLKHVARYYWRQNTLVMLCVLWPAFLAANVLPSWPWFASYFTGALAGILLSAIVIKIPALRRVLAPSGLTPGDVTKAAHVLILT